LRVASELENRSRPHEPQERIVQVLAQPGSPLSFHSPRQSSTGGFSCGTFYSSERRCGFPNGDDVVAIQDRDELLDVGARMHPERTRGLRDGVATPAHREVQV